MPRSLIVMSALVSAVACGSSDRISASDVAAYDQLAADLSNSAATYRNAAASMTSPADCTAALQHYMARARPDLDQMGPIAGRMDGQMGMMGRGTNSDMACGIAVMSSELARHGGAACVSTDMSANRVVALRHSDTMEQDSEHMRMRVAEMDELMGWSGGGMGGGMMGGGFRPDGGWTLPDGGSMGWDHAMSGCAFADGG